MRETLNEAAERRIAVLDPIKLVIDNYDANKSEDCFAPNHPLKPELGKRTVQLSKELWIEREDFMEEPAKGYFRLFPGNMVRLRYGYVVKCTKLRERCCRQRHYCALRIPARYQIRHAGLGCREGERQYSLGECRTCLRVRSTPVRQIV